MPADRGRKSRQCQTPDDESMGSSSPSLLNGNVAFTTNVTPGSFVQQQPEQSRSEDAGRQVHSKKKSVNHIPRPPNAFILFRSAFIKNQHVSTEVETSHSTLSKIIGITWQHLPDEERQVWHAKAKVAQAEHKRKFPQYAFKPVHNKPRGSVAEKRRVREVGLKDDKRCEKIAELLVCGKKGVELKEAIQEFDRHHVPQIITRFEAPITARSFSSTYPSSKVAKDASSSRSRHLSEPPHPQAVQRLRQSVPRSPSRPLEFMPESDEGEYIPPDIGSFQGQQCHSFDFNSYPYTNIPSSYSPSYETQAQAVGGSLEVPFDPSTIPSITISNSFVNMSEWARSHSPMSTSTGSMPTTPIAFPFNTFPTPTPHNQEFDYDQFASHSGYSEPFIGGEGGVLQVPSQFAPQGLGLDIKSSDFIRGEGGNLQVPAQFVTQGLGLNIKSSSVVHPDVDFSAFMASLPDYSS